MSENPLSNFKDLGIAPPLTPQLIRLRLQNAIQFTSNQNILNENIYARLKSSGNRNREIINEQTNTGKIVIAAFDLMGHTTSELKELTRTKSPVKDIYDNIKVFLAKKNKINTKGKFVEFNKTNFINRIFIRNFNKSSPTKVIQEYKQIPLSEKLSAINDFIDYLSKVFNETYSDSTKNIRIKAQNSFSDLKNAFKLSKLLYTDNPAETSILLEEFCKSI